jgi:2-dehydro-3-deoxyphosphogluconate aldolase / (4S)-4-hydroxy-2-oxoglutarate aldolase
MKDVFTKPLMERLERTGVAAVLTIDRTEDAVPLAQALLRGGIDIIELTLRTSSALDALAQIRKRVPEMVVGIGTILTPEQVGQAADAGAAFGVAPGTNPRVVREALRLRFPLAPGIATPSDIEQALDCGCQVLKFFPAEPSGGLPYLKSIATPYAYLGLRYIPLGGLHADNIRAYLEDPLILALGGSWIASRPLIQKRDWDGVERNARQASLLVQQVRKGG